MAIKKGLMSVVFSMVVFNINGMSVQQESVLLRAYYFELEKNCVSGEYAATWCWSETYNLLNLQNTSASVYKYIAWACAKAAQVLGKEKQDIYLESVERLLAPDRFRLGFALSLVQTLQLFKHDPRAHGLLVRLSKHFKRGSMRAVIQRTMSKMKIDEPAGSS